MIFFHKNIRLHASRYKGAQWHFITLCCLNRSAEFADPGQASYAKKFLARFAAGYDFAAHAYCVMPDHLHALIVGLNAASNLLAFVKAFKQKTNYEFQRRFHRLLWQKKFYDHILREGEDVASVAAYIWLNPVRQGLCVEPCEYAHSGSFTINWKKHFGQAEPWIPPWKEEAPAFPTQSVVTRRAGKAAATRLI